METLNWTLAECSCRLIKPYLYEYWEYVAWYNATWHKLRFCWFCKSSRGLLTSKSFNGIIYVICVLRSIPKHILFIQRLGLWWEQTWAFPLKVFDHILLWVFVNRRVIQFLHPVSFQNLNLLAPGLDSSSNTSTEIIFWLKNMATTRGTTACMWFTCCLLKQWRMNGIVINLF